MTNNSAGKPNGHAVRPRGGHLEVYDTHCSVVMHEPVSADGSHGPQSSPSQLCCMKQLMLRTPATFSCSVNMSADAFGVQLIIQNALVQKLPYLARMQKQKADQGSQKKTPKGQESSQKFDFNPPCPLWGFVSLLLVVEKQVVLEKWLGDIDSDPALATHTLQMAEFLECKAEKQAVCDWLLTVAKSVSQHIEESTGDAKIRRSAGSEPPAKRPCSRFTTSQYWHFIQVLKALPQAMCQEVVASLSGTQSRSACAEVAVLLPFTLQRTWLSSFWPVVDLRAARLTSMHWMCILSNIVHVETTVGSSLEGAPTQHLDTLNVLLPCDIKESLKNTLIGKWQYRKCPTHTLDKHLGQCMKCQTTREMNSPIQIIGRCQHPLASISNVSLAEACPAQNLEAMHISTARGQLLGILTALEGATSILRLKTLALHNFVLPPQHISVLGSIFHNLSGTLTELFFEHTGCDCKVQPWEYRTADKTALFRAIKMLGKLQILTMVNWEEFVDSDTECVQPLLDLQDLQAVYVNEVRDSPAFTCGLNFVSIQPAQEQ